MNTAASWKDMLNIEVAESQVTDNINDDFASNIY